MYNLNINKSSIVPTNLIVGRVLDKPFDTIQFKIHDGLDVMDLTGCTLEFRGTTPDDKKVTSNAIKILDAKSGEIEFTFPSNFYSAKGHFQNAYFVINKGTNSESTNDLLITVLNAVDFNLDDAPIIIDQLDDLIQAVIDDLNNQLSKVKGDIKQTQDNITALKKDVDAYKGQFNTEIARMQNQLYDLAKAINQTDIQRPQITSKDGSDKYVISNVNLTLQDNLKNMNIPVGLHTVIINSCSDNPTGTWLRGLLDVRVATNESNTQYYLWLSGMSQDATYSYVVNNGTSRGWKRLDGQVPKITNDNGNYNLLLSDKNKSTFELLKSQPMGVYSIYISDARDVPERWLTGIYQSTHESNTGRLIATSVVSGNTYSYNYNDGSDKGWKRLDGQVFKLTRDDGGSYITLSDKSKTTQEMLDKVDSGYKFITFGEASDLPSSWIYGFISTNGNGSFKAFLGTSVDGTVYNYNSITKVWKKLDRLEYGIATQSKSGLMSSTDKVKLDGLEKHSDATQSNSGLMSSTDKVKLDKLNDEKSYNITYKPGFKHYSDASAVVINKVGRIVSIEGVYTNEDVIAGGTTTIIGTVPDDCKPLVNSRCICQASGGNVYHATIMKNGDIELSRHSKGGEWVQVNAGSWLNIGKTYLSAN